MHVKSRLFRSSWESWEALMQKVERFATKIGPKNLITITHSEDQNDGVIMVWYWENDEDGKHDW